MSDRERRGKRFPARQVLLVRCESWSEFAERYASDVSRGGMFIVTDDPPDALSRVEVKICLPEGHEVVFDARIVHVIDAAAAAEAMREPGVGVEFVDLDAERERQIGHLVEFARWEGSGSTSAASFARRMFELSPVQSVAEVVASLPPPRPPSSHEAIHGRPSPSERPKRRKKQGRPSLSEANQPQTSVQPPQPRPSDPEKLKLALKHFAHRRNTDAIAVFEEMLRDNPGDLEASKWIHLAQARDHVAAGRQSEAAAAYRRALRHDENNLEARKFVREHALRDRLGMLPFGRFFTKR